MSEVSNAPPDGGATQKIQDRWGALPSRLTFEEINGLPDSVAEELLRLYMVEGFARDLVDLVEADELNDPIKDPELYAAAFNLSDGLRGFPLARDYQTRPGEKLKTLREMQCLQDNSHIQAAGGNEMERLGAGK